MPPPTTTPVPTPTQIVQLQLPKDVLDRLTPKDPSWFSQYGQTLAAVLTVLGVLLAATIAYRSAMRTIAAADDRAVADRAASSESLASQLKAQADTQREQHQADLRRVERAERVEAVLAASRSVTRYVQSILWNDAVSRSAHLPDAPSSERLMNVSDRLVDAASECWVCVERLRMLSLPSWEATQDFALACGKYRLEDDFTLLDLRQAEEKAQSALRADVP